jgi:uncharacterized protein YjgD (DUF1641 family)
LKPDCHSFSGIIRLCGRGAHRENLTDVVDDSLSEQKADGEVEIGAGRTHRDRDRRTVQANLHRLGQAPEEHAEAVLAAYEVLQQLHDRGLLELARGVLAAGDDILEKVADQARTPEAIRPIRNLIFWQHVLGSIEPEWFKGIFKSIPDGLAKATAEPEKPIGLFGLLRRLMTKDGLRGLAAATDFLQAFGRHLHSLESPNSEP